MAVGLDYDGDNVRVADQVTIMGRVSSHAAQSTTIVTLFGDTITVPASNEFAPQTDGSLISAAGKGFSDGDRVSIPGVVTAVGSGLGQNAQLTVLLNGGTSVSVLSGAVNGLNVQG
jgi:hypothetical protein